MGIEDDTKEFQICQVCQELTCECDEPTFIKAVADDVDKCFEQKLNASLNELIQDSRTALPGNIKSMDDETSTLEYTVQETFCDTCKEWSPSAKWKDGECPICVKEKEEAPKSDE